MKSKALSITGSIGAGVMSIVCCVGPIVLSALGVGGGALLAQLSPFRPYWIGLSVLILGVGFYLTYRPRTLTCADGTCKIERAGRWNKIALWSATVALAVIIALPYALGALAAQSTPVVQAPILPVSPTVTVTVSQPAPAQPGAPAAAVGTTLHELTLNVQGMYCLACPLVVKNFISSVPGVASVQVTFAPPHAVVVYDAAKTAPDQIIKSLHEPYSATILTDARAQKQP
jgi:mercuric ion transport protein